MMKRISHILMRALALLLLAGAALSCNGPAVEADSKIFADQQNVCLMVGYKNMIDFESGDLQYSVNISKHIYRAGVTFTQRDDAEAMDVQTVQQYYVLKTNEVLTDSPEDVVTGVLTLCSPTISSGIRTYDIKNGKVVKATDNQLWIWDSELHLGVVVRLFE